MAWYLFIRKDNGDIESEGSILSDFDDDIYEVRDVGQRVDWATKVWRASDRQIIDRLPPVLIDRLDDIQARFLADPDFSAVWGSLNATRRTQLRTGIMRVLASFIGARRFRQEDEQVEID
jgi:hypothetical protein